MEGSTAARRAAVVVGIAAVLVLAALSAPAAAADGETTIDREGDRVSLAAGPGQPITGDTALAAGTTVSVRLQASGETPFLMTRSAVVAADGGFRAVFDLSGIPAGTDFEVTVHHDGETLATAPGRTTPCRSACEAETPSTPSAQFDRDEGIVRVESAAGQVVSGSTNLPPGAVIAVRMKSTAGATPFLKSREVTVDAEGRFVAVFDYADVDAGGSFTAVVRHEGTELTSAAGEVVDCADCTRQPGTASPVSLGVVEVPYGETARLPLDVDGPATVTVGEFAGGFTVAATIRDTDGDGRVSLELATATAAEPRVVATGADEATVTVARGTPGATDYRVRLYAGTDVAVGAREDGDRVVASGSLVVRKGTGTPPVTFSPDAGRNGLPTGVAGALVGGALLGVVGIGLLVGLLRP